MIKLDWSKFKKVAGDKNSTTMQHDDGHQIRIAHNVLSPKMRGELAKLRSVKMAEGGEVEDQEADADAQDSEDGKNEESDSEVKAFGYAKGGIISVKKPKKMAEGGMVMQTGNKEQDAEQERRRKANPDVGTQTKKGGSDHPKPKQPTINERIGQPFYQGGMTDDPHATPGGEVASPMTAAMMGLPADSASPTGIPGPTGIPLDALVPPTSTGTGMTGVTGDNPPLDPNSIEALTRAAPSATERSAEEKNSPVFKQAAAEQAEANKPDGFAAAMQAAQTSAVDPAAAQAGMAAPAAAPTTPTAPTMSEGEKLLQSGMNGQISGLMDFAKEEQKLGAKRAEIAQQQADFLHKSISTYQEEKSKIDAEMNAALDDVRNKHIDPDHFWSNKSSFSKVLSGIGVVMAGYAAGVNGGENQALKYMQKQIDNDIEAQKADITKSENLLSYNFKKYGNLKDATEMTRATMMAITASQFEKAAAEAQGPQAQARAKIAAAEIKAKYAPVLEKKALMDTVNKLKGEVASDPSKANVLFDAIAKYDPKQAADLRQRFIPGSKEGFATVGGKEAGDLREQLANTNSAKQGIARLLKIANTPNKSVDFDLRAEADVIKQTLVGALRLPLTGPGAMNEGERKLLENVVADPASFFSLDTINKTKLKTLIRSLDDKLNASGAVLGVSFPAAVEAAETRMMKGKPYRLDPSGKYWVPVK